MAAMEPLSVRVLTPGERELAREMFGAALVVERVRLLALPLWRRAFVAGPRLMVWPAAEAHPDFGRAALEAQAVFVHELTHVWQAQRGVNLLWAKLRAGDSARAYAYDLAAGPGFERLNIEQQAMVVQHAFLARRGLAAPHPAEVYAEIAARWRGA